MYEHLDELPSSGLVQPFKWDVRQFFASYRSAMMGRSSATIEFHTREVNRLRSVLPDAVWQAIEIVAEEVLNG
jgi:hypothetical protein